MIAREDAPGSIEDATGRESAAARGGAPRRIPAWQRALGDAVSTVGELLDLVALTPAQLPEAHAADAAATRDFPLRVPRSFVARMRCGDPSDPLLLQVLPSRAELVPAPGYRVDPLLEVNFSPVSGLLYKYRGRALLVVTGACGIHCRYCFRRHFPYGEHAFGPRVWDGAIDWIAGEPSVEEVILSGGDPLAVDDAKLGALVDRLALIPHLRRLRVHTRMPVVVPERIDGRLLSWLCGRRFSPVVVLHANHAQELSSEVAAAVARLRRAGATVLNQAVLLAGVNDSVGALAELSRRLFDIGVVPYYLHLLDRVAGAAHFEVAATRARELQRGLLAELPGYLVPRLVREVPGAASKVALETVASALGAAAG